MAAIWRLSCARSARASSVWHGCALDCANRRRYSIFTGAIASCPAEVALTRTLYAASLCLVLAASACGQPAKDPAPAPGDDVAAADQVTAADHGSADQKPTTVPMAPSLNRAVPVNFQRLPQRTPLAVLAKRAPTATAALRRNGQQQSLHAAMHRMLPDRLQMRADVERRRGFHLFSQIHSVVPTLQQGYGMQQPQSRRPLRYN